MLTINRRRIREFIEGTLHCRLHRYLPHGNDPFVDIRRLMPEYLSRVVFDVGANVGQSAQRFASAFPHAEIYCFEPVQATFHRLEQATEKLSRVQCYQLAFGSKQEQLPISLQAISETNSLLSSKETRYDSGSVTETVQVEVLDSFCAQRNINQIDFLKIDTEGFDLEVLRGADRLLEDGCIKFIQVEAGMNFRNELHVPLEAFVSHLRQKGYVLFGIYEQTPEWVGETCLRRADALFCPINLASPGS